MIWDGRAIRDIREEDIRNLIDSGLEEHLQLEYKRELYEEGERGRREFLLDVCMFANTAGGVLLIGVSDRRDENGQPTGAPDPTAVLGMDVQNPEGVLAGYDARVMESIEERLAIESFGVRLENGRSVLVFRVPNSPLKPHSVRREGHIYFPARRERQRYFMNVREIRELVMRTASQLEQAKATLNRYFDGVRRNGNVPITPHLMIGLIPVFFADYMVDVQNPAVQRRITEFGRLRREHRNPTYTFEGLQRQGGDRFEHVVSLWRDGLLGVSLRLPVYGDANAEDSVDPRTIDAHLWAFVQQARTVYEVAGVTPPYILGMMLKAERPMRGVFPRTRNTPGG